MGHEKNNVRVESWKLFSALIHKITSYYHIFVVSKSKLITITQSLCALQHLRYFEEYAWFVIEMAPKCVFDLITSTDNHVWKFHPNPFIYLSVILLKDNAPNSREIKIHLDILNIWIGIQIFLSHFLFSLLLRLRKGGRDFRNRVICQRGVGLKLFNLRLPLYAGEMMIYQEYQSWLYMSLQ